MTKLLQTQSQKLVQRLELKPKMLQSLQMLAMPLLQLEQHIKNEIIANPLLEYSDEMEDDGPNRDEGVEKDGDAAVDDVLGETLEEARQLSDILDDWSDYHREDSDEDKAGPETYLKENSDPRREFAEQLQAFDLSSDEYDFALDLIESCDMQGFLPAEYKIDVVGKDYGLSAARSFQIHYIVMHLDPTGIAARDLAECLTVQLDEQQPHYDLIRNLINQDFSNLIHKRYQLLAEKYGVSIELINYCRSRIARLDPKPGLRIAADDTNYIVPDVIIKKVDDDFEIIINDFSSSGIALNRRYTDMIKSIKHDKQAVEYIRAKINSAKFLIKSMYMRVRTLDRVTRSIINHQRGFFYDQSGVLEPLTYAAVANELHVNESTISRVVRNKYADTPFGIMCLKDFFTSTAGKDRNYEAVSRQRVQCLIKEFVDAESPRNPLSDQELVKMLKERGIAVSRRVVNKYREQIGILNSRYRKK